MRPAPGKIPDVLPSFDKVLKNITYLMDVRRPRLLNHSISELVNTYSDGSPKWLTGSTVWLPAVFDQRHEDTDLDIVFSSKDSCERFITGALTVLPGYQRSANTWGSGRIIHADGQHVIDVWPLEDDESIEELLLTYPSDYQRCAYYMTWSGASPGYLTRIIKKRTRIKEATGGYGRARREAQTMEARVIGRPVEARVAPQPPAQPRRWTTVADAGQIAPITLTFAGQTLQPAPAPQPPQLPRWDEPIVGLLGDVAVVRNLADARGAQLDEIAQTVGVQRAEPPRAWALDATILEEET